MKQSNVFTICCGIGIKKLPPYMFGQQVLPNFLDQLGTANSNLSKRYILHQNLWNEFSDSTMMNSELVHNAPKGPTCCQKRKGDCEFLLCRYGFT